MKKWLVYIVSLVVVSTTLQASLKLESHTVVLSDPINHTTNPKRIPGSVIRHYYTIYNSSDSLAKKARFSTQIDLSRFDIKKSKIYVHTPTARYKQKLDKNLGVIKLSFARIQADESIAFYFDTTLK